MKIRNKAMMMVGVILAVVVIISSYFRIKKAMEKEQQNAFPAEGQD